MMWHYKGGRNGRGRNFFSSDVFMDVDLAGLNSHTKYLVENLTTERWEKINIQSQGIQRVL